jgi:NAD(P)-dependent dehydrogenase (short-subunit alcohol dehydrogenase family)
MPTGFVCVYLSSMKNVVITGAGSGMGRATATLLSEESDYRLILVGRNQESLEETRRACADHREHMVAALDVRSKEAWQAWWNHQGKSIDQLYAVFANAGVGGENHYGTNDRWSEIISTNLDGTYTTIMECLPYLRQSDASFKHILITSSCLARFGVPNYTAYCTAKTGLLGLTRSLAVQLAV